MKLSVTMSYSRDEIIQRLTKLNSNSSVLYSLLSNCLADWMLNPFPVFSGDQLLNCCIAQYGKRAYRPFTEALVARMTEGEYNNFDKFFALLENHSQEPWAYYAAAGVANALLKTGVSFSEQLLWRRRFYQGEIPADKTYDALERCKQYLSSHRQVIKALNQPQRKKVERYLQKLGL